MALTVGDMGDQIQVGTFGTAKQTVHSLDEDFDDVDVLPLVESADVVGVGDVALMEYQVDGTGMVNHIQPVTHVESLAIYWQRLTVTDIVDEQWNELLRELVWSIVVGAVGDDCRHAISIMERAYEMVAAGL